MWGIALELGAVSAKCSHSGIVQKSYTDDYEVLFTIPMSPKAKALKDGIEVFFDLQITT